MVMKSREKAVIDPAPPGTVISVELEPVPSGISVESESVESMRDAVEASRVYWKVAVDSAATARLVVREVVVL